MRSSYGPSYTSKEDQVKIGLHSPLYAVYKNSIADFKTKKYLKIERLEIRY